MAGWRHSHCRMIEGNRLGDISDLCLGSLYGGKSRGLGHLESTDRSLPHSSILHAAPVNWHFDTFSLHVYVRYLASTCRAASVSDLNLASRLGNLQVGKDRRGAPTALQTGPCSKLGQVVTLTWTGSGLYLRRVTGFRVEGGARCKSGTGEGKELPRLH